jgi:cold shock CspA family protein
LHGEEQIQFTDKDDWKVIITGDELSEAETEVSAEAPSSSAEEDIDETEQGGLCACVDADFDGMWNKAAIHNNVLSWHEGPWDAPCPSVNVDARSAKEFQMMYEGEVHQAELRDDGQLYWDDGDKWIRVQLKFEGRWSKASISRNILTWNEGEEVTIDIISPDSFCMTYVGNVYTATLQANGILRWDDGDVWRRAYDRAEVSATLPPWLRHSRCKRAFADCAPKLTVKELPNRKCAEEKRQLQKDHVHIPEQLLVRMSTEKVSPDVAPTASKVEESIKVGVAEDREKPSAIALPPWLQSFRRRDATKSCDAKVDLADSSRAKDISEKECFPQHQRCMRGGRHPDISPDVAPDACTHIQVPQIERNARVDTVRQESPESNLHARDIFAAFHSPQMKASAAPSLRPVDTRVYQGIVKWFRGAYGWLVCEALAKDFPDTDVFLHKNDCNFKPRPGDEVCFRMALNGQGIPQAVKVAMQDRINARDWFDAKASNKAK